MENKEFLQKSEQIKKKLKKITLDLMLLTKQKKKKKVSTEIMMLKELMGKVNQNTPFNILRYKYRLKV